MAHHNKYHHQISEYPRVARWAGFAFGTMCVGVMGLGIMSPIVLAAGAFASVTASATGIPNSYRLAVTATGLQSGDIVDVHVVNQKTGETIQQFYQTATASTLSFVDNTEVLPPDTLIAENIYIQQPDWGPMISSMTDLNPTETSSADDQTFTEEALAYYPNWLRQYVQSAVHSGLRVVYPTEGNATVSEGQGYGMLIAALANDAPTFAGLWDYAQRHLDDHGLMNWKIGPSGTTLGKTSATNGDETMAQALIMAGWRWPGHGYGQAGINMANAIYQYDLMANLLVGPGDAWAGPQTESDIAPGYIDPYAYQVFAQVDGHRRWQKVLTTNLTWLKTVGANSSTGLVPDWETIEGHPVVPPGSDNPNQADTYYENAAPYPIWMVQWVERSGSHALAQTLGHFLASAPLSDGYTLTGKPLSSGYTNLPFLSGTAILTTVEDPQSQASAADFNQLLTQQATSYYGAVLKTLALFILADPHVGEPPTVIAPSVVAVNTPFHLTISHIPSGTQKIVVVLPSQGGQRPSYTVATWPVSSGQSSANLQATLPRTLTLGTRSYTLSGGPHTLQVEFLNPVGILQTVSRPVNITGVSDDHSPYQLTYNPKTSKITITHVPSGSTVTVFFQATGQAQGSGSGAVLGSASDVGPGTISLTVHGIHHESGYLLAEIAPPTGQPLDTNPLSLKSGIPMDQAPEVPWAAALLPTVGLVVILIMIRKKA